MLYDWFFRSEFVELLSFFKQKLNILGENESIESQENFYNVFRNGNFSLLFFCDFLTVRPFF